MKGSIIMASQGKKSTSSSSSADRSTTDRDQSTVDEPATAPQLQFTHADETEASPASVNAPNVGTGETGEVSDAGDRPTLTEGELSATQHPSGNLTVTRDGAAVGIKNFDSVEGNEGPRSQLDLDARNE